MEDTIIKAALNLGVLPSVTIYLIFVIIKDFRSDISSLKSKSDEYQRELVKQYSEINTSMNELVQVNEQMQTYIVTYLNSLLLKLLDVLEDYDNK